MEHEFTLNGRRFHVTDEQVVNALRGVRPGRVHLHTVEVSGLRYPITQAFRLTFGLQPREFRTNAARRVFIALGFPVYCPAPYFVSPEPGPGEPDPESGESREEVLAFGDIHLEWSRWYQWHELEEDCRHGGGVLVPRKQSGVYEVKRVGEERRLIIGRAVDLSMRVKYCLINGTLPYPAGRKIEEYDDISLARIRWALTNRPAAVEEELHQRHIRRFGDLPTYTVHT